MKDYIIYECPECSKKYIIQKDSFHVKIGGKMCDKCETHFGVDAAKKILRVEDPMSVHDCPEEGQMNKISAITSERECGYCGEEIKSVKMIEPEDD